jgi:hypothetical protein
MAEFLPPPQRGRWLVALEVVWCRDAVVAQADEVG